MQCLLRSPFARVAGLERLNGMFALAIYSRRDRTLILGRDRLGIKLLCYAALPDRAAFASEIKGLLPLLTRVSEISPEALARFFEIGFSSGAKTILQGIRKLEPGTALVIDASLKPRQITYWSALDIQPRAMRIKEVCEGLDPLFDQVLREHMRSDVPFGLFLSGGLDSGILMTRLLRWGNAQLRTFSVGYAGADAGGRACGGSSGHWAEPFLPRGQSEGPGRSGRRGGFMPDDAVQRGSANPTDARLRVPTAMRTD